MSERKIFIGFDGVELSIVGAALGAFARTAHQMSLSGEFDEKAREKAAALADKSVDLLRYLCVAAEDADKPVAKDLN